jgi:hypothetical protein
MVLRRSCVTLALAVALAMSNPQTGSAQDDPAPVVYASYMQCDPGSAARASEIIRDSWGPVVQARVASGEITAWGSLTHHTGGEWSRAIYHVAADAPTLLAALDEMGAEWMESDPDGAAELWDGCEEHEDYVWQYVTGSDPVAELATERPSHGMSVYWTCDEGREAVADLIVEHVFGEHWNAQVEAGLVNSWSWMAHYLGDKYRRILVADGSSHANLLAARTNVIQAMTESSSALASEFNNICNGHVDYLWNIEVAEP